MKTLVKNIQKIITWDIEYKEIISNSSAKIGLIIKDEKIFDIINHDNYKSNDYDKIIDAKGGVVTPGFIDCHTHPIFSGNRSHEFNLRVKGETYQEIANKGGGIKHSIKKIRQSSKNQIFDECIPRIESFLKKGTTTIEAKSGYGLTLEDEIKSLEVIKMLNKFSDLDIIPTFMGAHDFPEEYKSNKDKYVDLICDRMIPEIADKKLAVFCDVFCEKGYFNIKQSEKILKTGIEYKLVPRLHADEFVDSDAAKLAADIGAVSADHLMFSSDDNLNNMARQGVVAVLLPGTTFFLGKDKYVDSRKILNFKGEIAIASDFNPGSCTIQSMPLIMFLSNMYCKLPIDLSFKACTSNAAKVLKIDDSVGVIKKGFKADILIWSINNLQDIPYSFDSSDNCIQVIIKNGKEINL
ncbi:MAG: imidazolonepropionase [Candidatus Marinimicrobia bacterium]|nr:imidazolonepropionase [Candidatus Neomarinimicrobiota bacterium]|tara:strand:- start:8596 stop:9822 length:1227 start_codon:yes stop_codon:yes gene_type:complete